jgi:hypothetical protein
MSMLFELSLPDLSSLKTGFPQFYEELPTYDDAILNVRTRALMGLFVRLTEAALRRYDSGRLVVESLWSGRLKRQTNGIYTVAIPVLLDACSDFESCVTATHRATECMRAIKSQRFVPRDLQSALPKRIRFIEETVAARVRDLRNAVLHFEEQILHGDLENGGPTTLFAYGPQTLRDGKLVQKIDRLRIADLEITFAELCQILREMAACAERLARYKAVPVASGLRGTPMAHDGCAT